MKEASDAQFIISEYICKKCGRGAKETDAREFCPECKEIKPFVPIMIALKKRKE